jgi:hypothetical protein
VPVVNGTHVVGPLIVDAADVARTPSVRAHSGWTVAADLTVGSARIFDEATHAAVGAPRHEIRSPSSSPALSCPHLR